MRVRSITKIVSRIPTIGMNICRISWYIFRCTVFMSFRLSEEVLIARALPRYGIGSACIPDSS